MREPISRDSASPRELAEATRRLDRALKQLEAACATKLDAPSADPGRAAFAALESDRARLAAKLKAELAREGELESAAAAASQALGRAAAEVRAALEADGAETDDIGEGEALLAQAPVDEGPDVADPGGDVEAAKPSGDGFNEEAA